MQYQRSQQSIAKRWAKQLPFAQCSPLRPRLTVAAVVLGLSLITLKPVARSPAVTPLALGCAGTSGGRSRWDLRVRRPFIDSVPQRICGGGECHPRGQPVRQLRADSVPAGKFSCTGHMFGWRAKSYAQHQSDLNVVGGGKPK